MPSFLAWLSCIKRNDESIEVLDFANSRLTDVPTSISQYERTLEELYLSSNRITDLSPELFYCQGLLVLKLNDNELVNIPNAIGSLRHLHTLDLNRNLIEHIPDSLRSCRHLTKLDLSLNSIKRLPDAITSLISLKELYLNEIYLDFLPANFGRLVNLKILELRLNNLVALPKSMTRLTALNRLDIGSNEFPDLPEVIGHLTQLTELWADCNRIQHICANVSNLTQLVHFEVSNNNIDVLPQEISHWKNLEVLSVSSNNLESLPFSIGMLKNLKILRCDVNKLKELPDSICYLENIEEIFVNHNCLLKLPSTIGLLRKLRFLGAENNFLRRLPTEICSCIGLKVLNLHENKLMELPQDIGQLSNLEVLNVVDNALSYFPVSTLNLEKLRAIWISDNQSKPLVQFHYLDNLTKTELTCLLLPQPNAVQRQMKRQLDQQPEEYFEHQEVYETHIPFSSVCSTLQQQQQQQQWKNHEVHQGNERNSNYKNENEENINSSVHYRQQNSNNNSINSPSRRICFADEFPNGKKDIPSKRLMRSPTPYPKELKVMSKHVKNGSVNNRNANVTTGDRMRNGNLEDGCGSKDYQEIKGIGEVEQMKNQQNQKNIHQFQQDLFHVKETRSFSSHCNGNNIDIQNPNYLYIPNTVDNNNSSNITNNHIINSSKPISSRVKFINNCDNYEIILENNGNATEIDLDSFENKMNTAENTYKTANNIGNKTANDSVDGCNLQQNQDNVPSYVEINNVMNNRDNLITYPSEQTNHQQYVETMQNHKKHIASPRNYYENQCQELNAFNQQFHFHAQFQNQQQRYPPPYCIAKTFTKKSREDLINYESIRNRSLTLSSSSEIDDIISGINLKENIFKNTTENIIQNNQQQSTEEYNYVPLCEIQNCEKNLKSKEENDNIPISYDSKNYIKDSNFRNSDPINRDNFINNHFIDRNCNESLPNQNKLESCNIINNNNVNGHLISENDRNFPFIVNRPSSAMSTQSLRISSTINNPEKEQNEYEKIKHITQENNTDNKDNNDAAEQNIIIISDNDIFDNTIKKKKLQLIKSSPSSPWFFGLHKNPRVMQIFFKRAPNLGFDIKEIENQGIFVSIITPNSPAADFLRVNDKILDVDGVSFEKLNLKEAKDILMNSKDPVIYIMISRI